MKISELLNSIKENLDYISNSLLLQSSDNNGCVYKFLFKCGTMAARKKIFITLDENESELDLLDKTVINHIEIYPAH